MSNGMLPSYLSMAKPNPADKRAPWFKGTAPVYAGIFLWVVFYMKIADGTLSKAGLGLSLLGLVVGCPDMLFPVLPCPGSFGDEDGLPALRRRLIDVWHSGRFFNARVADGSFAVRLACGQFSRIDKFYSSGVRILMPRRERPSLSLCQ